MDEPPEFSHPKIVLLSRTVSSLNFKKVSILNGSASEIFIDFIFFCCGWSFEKLPNSCYSRWNVFYFCSPLCSPNDRIFVRKKYSIEENPVLLTIVSHWNEPFLLSDERYRLFFVRAQRISESPDVFEKRSFVSRCAGCQFAPALSIHSTIWTSFAAWNHMLQRNGAEHGRFRSLPKSITGRFLNSAYQGLRWQKQPSQTVGRPRFAGRFSQTIAFPEGLVHLSAPNWSISQTAPKMSRSCLIILALSAIGKL